MNYGQTGNGAYNLERLCTSQARERIALCPALILPLGGCEPFGGMGTLGTESVCAYKVAQELSGRFGILTAPLIPYGCSTPFISFAGAGGVKPRTFVNMLCEILHGYVFQGVRRIFLINAAPFNAEPAAEALVRLEAKYPEVKGVLFNIGDYDTEGAEKSCDTDRNDALLLSLLAYLSPDMFKDNAPKALTKGNAPKALIKEYWGWRKRGRDPRKLAALFPEGTFLAADAHISGQQGKRFFERIIEEISVKIEELKDARQHSAKDTSKRT